MKNVLSSLVLATACLLSQTAVTAEPASAQSIKHMMQMTGAGDIGMQMINQMLPALKNMAPDAPDSFWVDVMAEIDTNEIEDLVIPVYQKYLTEADIQAINNFYQTPSGKKLIKVQPSMIQESFVIGQQWGQGVAKKILMKYKNKADK